MRKKVMEKCKFCQAELAENDTVCPNCGKDNAPEQAESAPEAVQPVAAEEAQTQEVTSDSSAANEEAETPAAPVEETQQQDDQEPQIQEGLKATPGKIALMAAAVVVLLAVLIALIVAGLSQQKPADANATDATTVETTPATVPADGNPEDVTCKGTYTVTDEEAKQNQQTVVATIGERQLTNGQLQVYYWMEVQSFLNTYGAYAPYFGLDYTKPLDTQVSVEDESLTWQQFFLQRALNNWQQVQAMSMEAAINGIEMNPEDQEYLDTLQQQMEELAQSYDMTLDELLLTNLGPGAGMEEYHYFQEQYLKGLPYFQAETAKIVPTEADLEAFFTEHEEDYANSGITKDSMFVDVRHILVQITGGTTDEEGNTTYTDEEWAACEEKAQAILDEWLAGEKTEDSFAALATEKSEDPGSQANGGLYERVTEGQMVAPFNDWCFDASRKTGDYGLVKTDYGYHVMYFVGTQPQWKYYAESDWVGEETNKLIDKLVEKNPMEVAYENITLGNVNLGA